MKIPTEDFTDETLAIDDTYGDDVREIVVLVKKRFFVKPLHKMVTPPPSPFYEVPIYFFSDHFLIEKKDDFEGCLKGVDGCFKGA